MEKQFKPINQFLATNQPERSQTLNSLATITKEKMACHSCNQEKETSVSRKDGIIIYPKNFECDECRKNNKIEESKEKAEKELQKAINNVRSFYEESADILMFGKTFENFNAKLQPKAFNAVKSLHWKWLDGDKPAQSLVLYSPNVFGVGKTHLVCALAHHIANNEIAAELEFDRINEEYRVREYVGDKPVKIIQENKLLRRIRDTYNKDSKETEDKIFKELSEVELLIIDDVGKVRPQNLSFLQGVWFDIIDSRYNYGKAVVITTNLDIKGEFEQHIGGATADRLREMCGKNGFIKMEGESYRKGKSNG